jgi:hypothetical protein
MLCRISPVLPENIAATAGTRNSSNIANTTNMGNISNTTAASNSRPPDKQTWRANKP